MMPSSAHCSRFRRKYILFAVLTVWAASLAPEQTRLRVRSSPAPAQWGEGGLTSKSPGPMWGYEGTPGLAGDRMSLPPDTWGGRGVTPTFQSAGTPGLPAALQGYSTPQPDLFQSPSGILLEPGKNVSQTNRGNNNQQDNSVQSLYMDNLPPDIQAKHLRQLFGKYGEVVAINILQNKNRQQYGGTLAGFVNIRGMDASVRAINALNEKQVFRECDGPIHVRLKGATLSAPTQYRTKAQMLQQRQEVIGNAQASSQSQNQQQQRPPPHSQPREIYDPVQGIYMSPPPEFLMGDQPYPPDQYSQQGLGSYGEGSEGIAQKTQLVRPGIKTWYPDPQNSMHLSGSTRVKLRIVATLPRIAPDENGAYRYDKITRFGYGEGRSWFHGHIWGTLPLKTFDGVKAYVEKKTGRNLTHIEPRRVLDDNKWSVFVGGLPLSADLDDLYKGFEYFGSVDRIRTVKPKRGWHLSFVISIIFILTTFVANLDTVDL